MYLEDHYFTIQTTTMVQMLDKLKITCKMINLFHTTGLFDEKIRGYRKRPVA